VLVVDLGGQYSQLIARRVRECRVYSELVRHEISAEEARRRNPAALILSGGPASVYAEAPPRIDTGLYRLGVPMLGICYGAQLMALDLGGSVEQPLASRSPSLSSPSVLPSRSRLDSHGGVNIPTGMYLCNRPASAKRATRRSAPWPEPLQKAIIGYEKLQPDRS